MNTWTTEDGYFGKFETNATNQLTSPWSAGTNAVTAFKNSTSDQMAQVTSNIEANVTKAKAQLDSLYKKVQDTPTMPSGSSNTGGTTTTTTTTTATTTPTIYSVYGVSNTDVLNLGLGPLSLEGFEKYLKNYDIGLYVQNGTNKVRKASSEEKKKKMLSNNPVAISGPAAVKKHAKGTLGTKRDEWAITDEPWLGDELTMYATKQGTLSYMRAGSTVIPADLTKELMAIGELGLDGLTNMPQFNSGITLMSNVINKPELNVNFDSLVHVDHCDEGTLQSLEKMVDAKINQFGKQLNYSIKKFAR
jgi:hypothetical protein